MRLRPVDFQNERGPQAGLDLPRKHFSAVRMHTCPNIMDLDML